MRATARLWQHALRLTLFTRQNCGLCDEAKYALSKVKSKKPFEYEEIDVMSSGQSRWRDLYEFDTPVIHIDTDGQATSAKSKKLMHHITEADVHKAMDEVEEAST